MKKTFKKEACGLVLLGLLPLMALPIVNRIQFERIAQRDIETGCSFEAGDCLPTLIQLSQEHPYTYRFQVFASHGVGLNSYFVSWSYDRQKRTVTVISQPGAGWIGDRNNETIYSGVSDELLKIFAKKIKKIKPGEYRSEFEKFCQANGCVNTNKTW